MKEQFLFHHHHHLLLLLLLLLASTASANPALISGLEITTEPPVTSTDADSDETTAAAVIPKGKTLEEETATAREIKLEREMKVIKQQCADALQRTGLLGDALTSLHDDLSSTRARQRELERSLRAAEIGAKAGAAARKELRREIVDLRAELAALRTTSATEAAAQRRAAMAQAVATKQVRVQLTGLMALTTAFAQNINATARATAEKLRQRLATAGERFGAAKEALERRLRGLEGRQRAAELRMSMWNMTRALQSCQKSARDKRQEAELEVLRLRTNHLSTAAAGLRNLTTTLQNILYDNNRITNLLTNFKNRARGAIDSLVLNMAHLAKTLPKSCSSDNVEPSRPSSILLIVPNFRAGEMRAVQCRFDDVDSWTVIQQRFRHDVNFNRRWAEYEAGFGEAKGDYWLGLRPIHNVLATGKWKLRIDLWDKKGRYFYAVYRRFYVGPRATNYLLQVGDYYGNASDTLSRASGYGFSAPDRDADGTVVHCAQFEEAGWWMAHCHDSNLNGKKPFGIIWYHTPLQDYLHLRSTRMMVAPLTDADFTTTEAPTTTMEPPTTPPEFPEFQRNETLGTEGNDTEEAGSYASQNDTESADEFEGFRNSTEVLNEFESSQNATDISDDYEGARNATDILDEIERPLSATEIPDDVDSSENVTENFGSTEASQKERTSSDGKNSTQKSSDLVKPVQNITESVISSNKTNKVDEMLPTAEQVTQKPDKAKFKEQPGRAELSTGKPAQTDQSKKKQDKAEKSTSLETSGKYDGKSSKDKTVDDKMKEKKKTEKEERKTKTLKEFQKEKLKREEGAEVENRGRKNKNDDENDENEVMKKEKEKEEEEKKEKEEKEKEKEEEKKKKKEEEEKKEKEEKEKEEEKKKKEKKKEEEEKEEKEEKKKEEGEKVKEKKEEAD